MRKVPFFSFELVPSDHKNQWKNAIARAIDAGRFVGGDLVSEFEHNWGLAINAKYSIGVGNGFDGLVIALKALGVGPGDRVAVPAHTFIATWNAVSAVGATPVGVDVDNSGLLDLNELKKISNLKCVIPVHMHGAMVDMAKLTDWTSVNSIRVIEDASQAHFAKSQYGYAGTLGDIGVFSMYPTKNLGALGDAGIVVTDNVSIEKFIRTFANYGASREDKYFHNVFGVNSRLDTIQAAVLLVNLTKSQSWTEHRKHLAKIYLENIKNNDSVRFMYSNPEISVWHHFPILTDRRSLLIEHLQQNNIGSEIHYPNLAGHEFSRMMGQNSVNYPIGESISKSILSLPISQWHTEADILYVSEVVNEFSQKK